MSKRQPFVPTWARGRETSQWARLDRDETLADRVRADDVRIPADGGRLIPVRTLAQDVAR